jgi:CRP/FNR family cyclic AMP-dependent transcriptional regulator
VTEETVPHILSLTTALPERLLDAGDTLINEGTPGTMIWILVSGELDVSKGGMTVNRVVDPGAVIGEMSVLLQRPHSATVRATVPSVVRVADDGKALLNGDPAFTHLVAVGLAERLAFVTSYLSDLQHQYDDAPGLAMVADVVSQIERSRGRRAITGSQRQPNPDY